MRIEAAASILLLLLTAPTGRAESETSSDPAALLAAATRAGGYLLRHQDAAGRFAEVCPPEGGACTDRLDPRHQPAARSALLRLFHTTGEARFFAAAVRGFEGQPDSPSEGTAAAELLAHLERHRTTREEQALERARERGRLLLSVQADDGSFHPGPLEGRPGVLTGPPSWFAGEAAFALVRLGEEDPQGPWRAAAARAAGWAMGVRDLGLSFDRLPRDLGLLLALDRLHALDEEGHTYYLHARRMTAGFLRPQHAAGTEEDAPPALEAAERLRALLAMERIARRNQLDETTYRKAALEAAEHLLHRQAAGSGPRAGGFQLTPAGGEIRLDAVHQALAALLELRARLLETETAPAAPAPATTPAER